EEPCGASLLYGVRHNGSHNGSQAFRDSPRTGEDPGYGTRDGRQVCRRNPREHSQTGYRARNRGRRVFRNRGEAARHFEYAVGYGRGQVLGCPPEPGDDSRRALGEDRCEILGYGSGPSEDSGCHVGYGWGLSQSPEPVEDSVHDVRERRSLRQELACRLAYAVG